MQPEEIKAKDLVTVDIGEANDASNTYVVKAILDSGEALLFHPLVPECYILETTDKLNTVQPTLQSPFERCLWFVHKNKGLLGYNNNKALEAILLLFVTKKTLSSAQKSEIQKMCGRVAAIHTDGNIAFAARKVCQNQALLDSYNSRLYTKYIDYFNDPKKILDMEHRQVVLRVAGFILAQESEFQCK